MNYEKPFRPSATSPTRGGKNEQIKICVKVLGCRTNLYEGDFLAGALKSRGAVITENFEGADAAVIVSCSVTQEADRKCRQLIRRARRALGDNGILAVCGCWAQGVSAEAAQELGIDILTGNRNKNILPDIIFSQIEDRENPQPAPRTLRRKLLRRSLKESRVLASSINVNEDAESSRPSFRGDVASGDKGVLSPQNWQWEELSLADRPLMHTRAFIKIQDGCDHFCSYCIIPFLRGRPVSRPLNNIIDEIKRVVDGGCKEIVLTGIHLGMYGRDINSSLSEVINALSKVKGLERLRMGSLEPFSLNIELMKTLADCEIFCPHLHLPLQSGDDKILSLMRRGYTSGEFKRVCDTAREIFNAHAPRLGDDLHISSDILVGFPGETDEAFNNTLKLMRDAGLGRVHVFPYSPRRGTLAEKLYSADKIPDKIKSERADAAINLGRELLNNYANRFINREIEILVEDVNHNKITGHTPHFLEAEADIAELNCDLKLDDMKNKIIKIKVIEVKDDGKLEGIYVNGI